MEERRNVLALFESADWKTTAAQRIETYRKGEARITVRTQDGTPIPDAMIHILQTNHAFKFGANLFMLEELETEEKNARYKQAFADLFNMATLPFYWDATEPEQGKTRYRKDAPKLYRRPPIDLCIEYCQSHNIEPREHALAYEHFFPKWLQHASVEEIKSAYEKRCQEISTRYADKIPTIEVTNEMVWEKGITSFYEDPDFILWCFQTARKYFPHNQLGINEWSGLPWTDRCRTTDKYYAYTEANLLKGAPIDAVGMQFHMFFPKEKEFDATRPYYDPENLLRHMDLYARLQKPLQITEVTIPAYSDAQEDEAIQAKLLEYLYTLWFSHPATEQIIYWNLVDGYAAFAPLGDMTRGENIYAGGLMRFDLTPKPAYYTLQNLIRQVWHTEESAPSDQNGTAVFRPFYGDYTVEVTKGGQTVTKQISFQKQGDGEFTVVL